MPGACTRQRFHRAKPDPPARHLRLPVVRPPHAALSAAPLALRPADLGALLVVDYIRKTLGKKTAKVTTLTLDFKGGVSGGTIASGAAWPPT